MKANIYIFMNNPIRLEHSQQRLVVAADFNTNSFINGDCDTTINVKYWNQLSESRWAAWSRLSSLRLNCLRSPVWSLTAPLCGGDVTSPRPVAAHLWMLRRALCCRRRSALSWITTPNRRWNASPNHRRTLIRREANRHKEQVDLKSSGPLRQKSWRN